MSKETTTAGSGAPPGAKSTLASIAEEVRNASVKLLSDTKEAIKTVAPALWKVIKLKVIGDAAELLIIAGVAAGLVCWFWWSNRIVVSVVLLAAAVLASSAIKRIIASDYFSLLEVLKLKQGEGK